MPGKGACRLCEKIANLRMSHLIPAEVYRHIRGDEAGNPNPVLFSDRLRMTTSRQARQHLLCDLCEERFNSRGERWALSQMRLADGSFALGESLTVQQPTDKTLHAKWYPAPPNFEQLAYFAASVFWRAAVATWRMPKSSAWYSVKIDLGPFERRLREFLLEDKAAFPDGMALGLQVILHPVASRLLVMPMAGRMSDCRYYRFQIPGLNFWLWVSGRLPEVYRETCFAKNGLLWVTESATASGLGAAASVLAKTSRR